jgi:2-C-methyl-D-erythritol 4-phosphate cytidylyltransferase
MVLYPIMNTQVIIVAGGSGTRFKAKIPKSFVLLKRKPLIAHSLTIFEQNKAISGIIVVGRKDCLRRFEALKKSFKKIRAVVSGGATRADSVKCGLAAIEPDAEIILVHDAARPLIDPGMIERLLQALRTNKAVIAAVPVKATIKKVNPKTLAVMETLRRDLLWDVQTPQGFHKDVLVQAHRRAFKGEATDDAMLVERMGVKVKVVMGSYRNIKITTPEDLAIAGGL